MKSTSILQNTWGILPSALAGVEEMLSLSGAADGAQGGDWWDEYCAEVADEKHQAYFDKASGTLVLPIQGTLLRGASAEREAFWGFYDSRRIDAAAAMAAADTRITRLALVWDSPGGYCSGWEATVFALGAMQAARPGMPVASLVNGQCCSMAYVFANAAGGIEALRGTVVGSIGILNVTDDYSKMFSAAGIERRLFTDGIYKGMGTPGVPWKEEWYEAVKTGVMDLSASVRSGILAKRPSLTEADMQGQVWDAQRAPAGMVDAIAESLDAEGWLGEFATRSGA